MMTDKTQPKNDEQQDDPKDEVNRYWQVITVALFVWFTLVSAIKLKYDLTDGNGLDISYLPSLAGILLMLFGVVYLCVKGVKSIKRHKKIRR